MLSIAPFVELLTFSGAVILFSVRIPVCGLLRVLSLPGGSVQGCIWDSKTLGDEIRKDPTLAKAILSPESPAEDVASLRSRIEKLRSEPKESEPAWWNDLAGAYLRLGQPAEAIKI